MQTQDTKTNALDQDTPPPPVFFPYRICRCIKITSRLMASLRKKNGFISRVTSIFYKNTPENMNKGKTSMPTTMSLRTDRERHR